jgi:AcrR family transcriptional regulator
MTDLAPTDPSRRERKKLALRARILEAAASLFSERGYADTKVAEICARADVAQKTFFNHFASKPDVLREIATAGIADLLLDLERARKDERTTAARIARFFACMAERVEQGGPMHREFVTELVHAANGVPETPEHARRLHRGFEELVREGLASGELTQRHPPETLAQMILGAYYALIFDYANLDDYPIRARADAAARFLADALANRE